MKQLYISLMVCFTFSTAQAQNFTQSWKKLANGIDYTWFTADNNVTSLAFNPVTNKLLVSKRNDKIFVINPATGAQEDTLNTKSLGTEGLKNNKIRVAADGAIYGISLATGAGNAKIYRWASQADTATLCATFPVTERCGDAFGLSGSGVNTVLYASGAGVTSNAFSIYILNTADGKTFTNESKVTMTSTPTAGQQWSNRVVEPDGTGVNSAIWIKGGGFNARKITVSAKDANNVRTGTVALTIEDGVGSGQASIGYGGMRLFRTASNLKFLVLAGGNNQYAATKMTAMNITAESAPITFGIDSITPQAAYVTNGNGTGDVSFKDNGNNSFTVYHLSTNNGISATTSRIITGSKEVKSAEGLSVKAMENPVANELKLQINAATERKLTVQVMNSVGSVLATQQMVAVAGTNNLSFPTAQFASGLLFVTVYDGANLQTVKFLKQ